MPGRAGPGAGSVLVRAAAGKMVSTETVKYAATAGKQKPELFEGGVKDILETSFGAGSFEQSGPT
jgi:hypothetical protein